MAKNFSDFATTASPQLTHYAVGYSSAVSGGEKRWLLSDLRTLLQGNLGTAAFVASSTFEAAITAGTSAQYWRGDKTFQTLDKTAVGLGNVENTALSSWAGSTNLTTLGTIATGTWSATAIAATKGGTGLTGFTVGDILYASTTTALSKLAVGTSSQVLLGGTTPAWGTVPNAGLTNSSLTIGSTSVSLGATASTIAGLTLTSPTLTTPVLGTPSSGTLTNCTNFPAGSLSGATLASGVTASSLTSVGTLTALTISGNLTFSTTGNRILGDFSNATVASKVMFQTSTTDSATDVGVIPNGTSAIARVILHNNSTPTNAGILNLRATSTAAIVDSNITGSGTLLPLQLQIQGVAKLTLDTSGNTALAGNLTLSATGARILGDMSNATVASKVMFQTSTTDGATDLCVIPNGTSTTSRLILHNNATPTNAGIVNIRSNSTTAIFDSNHTGSGTTNDLQLQIDGVAKLTISASTGNVSLAGALNKWTFTAPSTAATLTAGADSCTYTLPAQTCSIGYLGIPQTSVSTAKTVALADNGTHWYHPSADTTARTWTIDSNANLALPIGFTMSGVNDASAGVLTIAITSDTLVWSPSGSTGSRTVAANGDFTILKLTSTRWRITGNGIT